MWCLNISDLGEDLEGLEYYSVAVVKEDNDGFDATELKDKKSCHTGIHPSIHFLRNSYYRGHEFNYTKHAR